MCFSNEELVVMYQNGDVSTLDTLIRENEKMIHLIVGKYKSVADEIYNDLFSVATYGFIKAVKTFDISMGYKLTTYATMVCNNEIGMEFRRINKANRELCILDEPVNEKSGYFGSIVDTFPDDCNTEKDYENDVIKKYLKQFIGKLPLKLKKLVEMYYFHDTKQEELMKIFNVSQAHISRMLSQAIGKLRDEFKKVGLYEQ